MPQATLGSGMNCLTCKNDTVVPLFSRIAQLQDHIQEQRENGYAIHFVPTMGALHQGHCDLITAAQDPRARVYVSIFVNPTQFNDKNDFDRYPRTIDSDLTVLKNYNVTGVFQPQVEELYPQGLSACAIEPGAKGEILEGKARPGHFSGMQTVVLKLLGIIKPEAIFFGEKDYQQLILVRELVKDFFIPTKVIGVPARREDSGLALSSRNRFLSATQKQLAPEVFTALNAGLAQAHNGPDAIKNAALAAISRYREFKLEYLALTDEELNPPKLGAAGRLLIAVQLGKIRLIDNVFIPRVG